MPMIVTVGREAIVTVGDLNLRKTNKKKISWLQFDNYVLAGVKGGENPDVPGSLDGVGVVVMLKTKISLTGSRILEFRVGGQRP